MIQKMNKLDNKTEIEQLYIDNYWGKSLLEIINWYSPLITFKAIKNYLIQNESFDDLLSILKYAKLQSQDQLSLDNDDAYFGFLDLMIVLEELAKRIMCFYYYAENWLAVDTKITYLKQQHINYQEFNNYCKLTKDLHYITPSEFDDYLHNASKLSYYDRLNKSSYYDTSLYEQIYMNHNQKYHYGQINKLFKEVLTRYDAQYCYYFINSEIVKLQKAKMFSDKYVMENLFDITILVQ